MKNVLYLMLVLCSSVIFGQGKTISGTISESNSLESVTTKTFFEVNSKVGYTVPSKKYDMDFEFYGGLKNMFNQYQSDFDKGKNRDSNYVYGPSLPRTVFFGLKISRN